MKSAKEAESHAKELGIWDEMFGNGKKGKRKSDANEDQKGPGGGEDGLAAMILKRQKDREGGLDRLAEKYRKIEEEERAKRAKGKGKGKGKGKKEEESATPGGPPVCILSVHRYGADGSRRLVMLISKRFRQSSLAERMERQRRN
jgi:hypothetical protein